MKSLHIYLLSLCMLAFASCTPEKLGDDDKNDGGGGTEQPVLPPVTPPSDPDEPGDNPGENPGENPGDNPGENPGDNPGDNPEQPSNPGLPPDEGEDTGGGDTPGPQPDPPYAEGIVEYYGVNLVASPTPASYQLVPTSNSIISPPNWWPAGAKLFFDPPYSGWHNYPLGGSKYALTSYIYDSKEDTRGDNWLITDGIQVQGTKSVLSWIAEAATAFPESYEVYLSTSPQLEQIKRLKPIYTCDTLVERTEPTKHITDVNYLLTGYQGQTIYLAFRHNTKGAFKLVMTLSKLSASTFPYDLQDLEVKSTLCWKATQPMIRGNMYPVGAELTVQMTVRNAGYVLTNTPLELSYTANGETVTEKTQPLTLKHGDTYTYTFNKKTTHAGGKHITVNVKPLPDEQRTYANNAYIALATTPRRLAKVLYEEVAATTCSSCERYLRLKSFEKLDEMVPERTVVAFTMADRNAQKAYPVETGDQYVRAICDVAKVPGWPNMTINRSPKYAYPNYRKMDCDYVNVPNILTVLDDEYAYEAYQPLDIRATHRYSTDLKTMHVDVTVTAEEDYAGGDMGIGAMILEDKVYHKNYTIVGTLLTYNHLVRAVLGDVKQGVRGVIPATVRAGDTFTYTFDYSVPEFYTELKPNLDELYAVVTIIKGDGSLMTCDKSAKRTVPTRAWAGSPWF